MDLKSLAPRIRCGVATKQELAAVPKEEILAILQDGPSYRFSGDISTKEVAGKPGERQVDHVASTESVDGMGDVIRVAGWDLRRVKTGALPVLYGHDSASLPVGVVKQAKKDRLPTGQRALLIRSEFLKAEDFAGDPAGTRAEAVYNLVSKGLIKGGSVGFIPKKMRWPDSEEREALGMDGMGIIFEEQELLEWSITPIPANQDAQKLRSLGRPILKAMVEGGKLGADEAQKLEDELFDTTTLEELLKPEKSVHAVGGVIEKVLEVVPDAKETVVPLPDGRSIPVATALTEAQVKVVCDAARAGNPSGSATTHVLPGGIGLTVSAASSGESISELASSLKELDTVELLELSTLLVAELSGRDDTDDPRHTRAAALAETASDAEPDRVNTLERKQDEILALLTEIRDGLKPASPESERAEERETEPDGLAGTSDTAVTRDSDPRAFQLALLKGISEHLQTHGV